MAANRYWLGRAIAIPEVKTYSVSGTWAGLDTASISINGKMLTLTLTLGDTMTTTAVTAALIDMINGAAANEHEKRSAVGSDVGEFALLTASVGSAADVLKLTGPSDGRPIGAVTVACVTNGDGDIVAIVGGDTIAGTGPNYWDNVDNWDADTLPATTDTIIFDHRAASSVYYSMANNYAPARIVVTDGFRYGIGLPAVNRDSPRYPFDEHLEQYATFLSCADVRINATNAQAIKLDFGTAATTVVVDGTGRGTESGVPPVLLKINHSSSAVTVNNGSVGICHESTVAGSVGTLISGGTGTPSVTVGDAVTLATVLVDSGSTTIRTAATTLTINGGSLEQIGAAIGATTLNVFGGTFYPKTAGSTYGTVNQSAGCIDCTKDSRSTRTFTNYYLYGGSLKDPTGTITFTNGIRIYPKLSAVSLDLPPLKKFTIGAV